MKTEVTITYLEMDHPKAFRPSSGKVPNLECRRVDPPDPEINRYFYSTVGRDWFWIDRLVWTEQQWRDWSDRPELETWIGYLNDEQVGYFELEHQPDENIEIAHFGLLPDHIGKGLGGALLMLAIKRAWEAGAKRVWLHSCTLDHPFALNNYQARGMRIFKMETQIKDVPGRI